MPRVSKKAIKGVVRWISSGSGITEGLDLMFCPTSGRFILKSEGDKFKTDVTLWNQPVTQKGDPSLNPHNA
jgi:hypothetical protein